MNFDSGKPVFIYRLEKVWLMQPSSLKEYSDCVDFVLWIDGKEFEGFDTLAQARAFIESRR